MEDALVVTEVAVRTDAAARVERKCMEEVEATVDGPGWRIITALPKDLWTKLRVMVKQALKQMVNTVGTDLDGFGCVRLCSSMEKHTIWRDPQSILLPLHSQTQKELKNGVCVRVVCLTHQICKHLPVRLRLEAVGMHVADKSCNQRLQRSAQGGNCNKRLPRVCCAVSS